MRKPSYWMLAMLLALFVGVSYAMAWHTPPLTPARLTVTTVEADPGLIWVKASLGYTNDGNGPVDSVYSTNNVNGQGVTVHWTAGQPARDSFLVNVSAATGPVTGAYSVQSIRNNIFSPTASAPWTYTPPPPTPAPVIQSVTTAP